MMIKVRLKNHGYVDGVMHQGDEIVVIDESKFTDTWMVKLENVNEEKKPGLIKRIMGKA